MGVFPKIWEYPQIIHFNRVWNHYKPSILGTPIFGNTHLFFLAIVIQHIYVYENMLDSQKQYTTH